MQANLTSQYRDKYAALKSNLIELIQARSEEEKTSTDIMFFSPPYWDVYSPFSAVPCLTANLRREGFCVSQVDLGIYAIHHVIEKNWRCAASRCMSEKFYIERVKPYIENTYNSYKEYLDDLWFFHGKSFNVTEVKSKYMELNSVQRGVVNVFYNYLYRMNMEEIDFDCCDDLERLVDQSITIDFLEVLSKDELRQKIKCLPQIVGISITGTSQFLAGCALAQIIKEGDPSIQIILGGSCADLFTKSLYPDKEKIKKYFDFIIVGEGETALKQLMLYIKDIGEVDLNKIPNLALFDEKNQIYFTQRIAEDVSTLPLPDYDGLNLDLYLAPHLVLPFQTSRGCHYGYCAFCNHDENYRHNYRSKQIKQAVKGLISLAKKYNTNYFQFVDEAIKPDCFRAMIEEMDLHPECKKMKWFYYSRVSRAYDSELLMKAKRNGCEMVMFGVETFNKRLLSFIKKGISSDTSKYCLDLFHRCGIKTFAWLMCNLPSESIKEAEEDFREVMRQADNMDSFVISLFYLSRNTDMYQNPEKYNITYIDKKDGTRFVSHHDGQGIDKEEMLRFYDKYKEIQWKLYFTGNRYMLFFK